MSSEFQNRMADIEKRKSQQRQGKDMTALQRIEMQRAGGERRLGQDRRISQREFGAPR